VLGAGLLLNRARRVRAGPVVWEIPHLRFASISAAVVVVGLLAAARDRRPPGGRCGPAATRGSCRRSPTSWQDGETVLELPRRPADALSARLAGFGDDDLVPVPGPPNGWPRSAPT